MKTTAPIEPLESRIAPSTFTVVNANDTGAGSLRQAILDANGHAGSDMIQISANLTISPASALPVISDPVSILSSSNTDPRIDGSLAGANVDGLVFGPGSTGSSISQINIYGYRGSGIVLNNGGTNQVTNIDIGDSVISLAAPGIGGSGIVVKSPNNTITGCTIAATGADGIRIQGATATGNDINHNHIGVVIFQFFTIGGAGVAVADGANNSITDNDIATTTGDGIAVQNAGASGTLISGNTYGVNSEGSSSPLGGDGISIRAENCVITENSIQLSLGAGIHVLAGGTANPTKIDGNQIFGNGTDGILIESGGAAKIGVNESNQIVSNSEDGVRVLGTGRATIVNNGISDNFGLPIDLGGDGPTPNDNGMPPDTDAGPNDLQNHPVIVEATALSNTSHLHAELHSTPNSQFLIQFFSDNVFDSETITTDANGLGVYDLDTTKSDGVRQGDEFFISATSNNGDGVTSEYTDGHYELGTEMVHITGQNKATWTDADGDRVTLKTNHGVLDYSDFEMVASGKGALLRTLFLDDSFNRGDLTITAAKVKGGDGLVNVGEIDAHGINLDTISIKGDLTDLMVGRFGTSQSLESLTVSSYGNAKAHGQSPAPFSGMSIIGNVGTIHIAGSIEATPIGIGGQIQQSFFVGRDFVDSSLNAARIANVQIGGDMVADTAPASIFADLTIGSVLVKGSLEGGAHRVTIAAEGRFEPVKAADAVAIRSVTIGKDVVNGDILAGFERAFAQTFAAINADVQIGSVTVGGNWTAGNMVAGVAAGADGFFGTADDALIPGGVADVISRIASVTIKGAVKESDAANYGFVAEEVGSFKIGKTSEPLTNGLDNIAVTTGGHVHIREV